MMVEFSGGKEKLVSKDEPIIFENKTNSSFDVNMGVVFHKSGLYQISIIGNRTIISTVGEPKIGEWIWKYDETDPNRGSDLVCSICGQRRYDSISVYNFCPYCGASMKER